MLVGKRIIVFGASANGKVACQYLSQNNEILYVVDNNQDKWGTYLGDYEVLSPSHILDNKDAVVVLAIVKRYTEVAFQLYEMGVENLWQFIEYHDLVSGMNDIRLRSLPKLLDCEFEKGRIQQSNIKATSNKNKTRNVLMFANYYPPIGGSGVQRPYKFAKYLHKFGYTPIVVTKGNCEVVLPMDYSVLDEIREVETIRIQEEPRYPEEMTKEDLELLYEILSTIGLSDEWIDDYLGLWRKKWQLLPDNDVTWVLDSIKTITKTVDLNNVSIVYTTIGPYSSAIIGAYLKLKYGIKWVLDYRDPWCLNDYNMRTFYGFRMDRRDYEKELEIALINKTDYVLTTAEVIGLDILKVCPSVKTKCITNGYDEDDFADIKNEEQTTDIFSLLFNGYIYDYYEINPILEVLNCLIAEGKIDKKKIQFEFNGSSSSKLDELKKNDRYGIVKENGYLPHVESIRSLFRANILLLYGAYGEGAYMSYSGKVFEYLRTGIPVLSISSPFGVQHEMIEKHDHGITATIDDLDKIKDFIVNLYNDWKNKKFKNIPDPDAYVKSFSREVLTENLADVFDELLDIKS